MNPADILSAAFADGVRVTLSQDGLRLSGDRQAVQKWTIAVRENREDIIESAKVAELKALLTVLLWDTPDEVEPEVLRWRANPDEGLALYRLIYEEYDRLGEIPKSVEGGGWGITVTPPTPN